MGFRDVLARRRMHRAFLPDPLPREQIERIAGVIRRAPSGGFSQGGSIVVVTDEAKRREIAERFLRRGIAAPFPRIADRERSGQFAHDATVPRYEGRYRSE